MYFRFFIVFCHDKIPRIFIVFTNFYEYPLISARKLFKKRSSWNRNVVHLDYDAITMGIFHSRVHVPRTRRGDIIRKDGKKSGSYLQLFANS